MIKTSLIFVILFFMIFCLFSVIVLKIDRLRGERKEMVKWINTSTSSVRVVKKPEQHAQGRSVRSYRGPGCYNHRRNAETMHRGD